MKKILLIEDEILIQKSLKKLLEARGAVVSVESSGKEAIETIFQNEFDKIVCDLMLKDITGFDVIEESKKKYTIEEIGKLFVIITAYSSQQVLDKAKSYGCSVLSKPFEDMNTALETFLG
ncbi:MAG: CheY-like chemotaxis protein [Bacteriovoracaceae bacterium]